MDNAVTAVQILKSPHHGADVSHITPVRRRIDELSGLRQNLLVLSTDRHLKLTRLEPNFTAPAASMEGIQWFAGAAQVGDWPQLRADDAAPAYTPLTACSDGSPFTPWRYGTKAFGAPTLLSLGLTDHSGQRMVVSLSAPSAEDQHPKVNVKYAWVLSFVEILHLIDSAIAFLWLMFVRLLAALSRHPTAVAFGLVILATCFRYGRRSEPSDDNFLPMRRYQTSLGSCSHG